MLARILIFLVINFAALGLGGLFTGPGTSSDWYTNLRKIAVLASFLYNEYPGLLHWSYLTPTKKEKKIARNQ